ncbi:MAG: dockerin type I domain-containing protein [Chthoniobacterales bacterium]
MLHSRLLVLPLLFAAVVSASAQKKAPPRKPLPLEALEEYEDAPMLLWRTGESPRMISQFDTFTSYQVNVSSNGMNITGDAANEPSICVDPTNPTRMAIGWRQFNSVASNCRQSGWGYTTNGGANWTFPGVLENNVFRSDPVLFADETGRFFSLRLLQTFSDEMWRSPDGAQNWTRLAPATGDDKQWFTIDTTLSSMGHGFQYQIWSTGGNNYGGRQFSRSADGGTTWINPVNIPNSPAWGTPDVDASGNLYVGGTNLNTGQIWCERSVSAKNAAATPIFEQSTLVNLGGSITISDPINPVGLIGQIFLAADRSSTSANGNVYMLASVQPTGFSTGSEVMFVRSTNGGQTFSAPVRVNDDPVNHAKHHWMATMAVAPNGRIDVIWLDTRNAANNTDSQLFYTFSTNAGTTWAPSVQVSNSFNPLIGYPNQSKMGDYMTMVSDNNGGHVAYSATFNGEEDIYYVHVAPAVPTVQSAVSRKVHTGVGAFDIQLPVTGNVGIECRTGPDYQIVVDFGAPVTLANATVASGTGSVSSFSASGTQVTVNLTGVTSAQVVTVKLGSVNTGAAFGDVNIPMGVLVGDVGGNGSTSSTDVGQTKALVAVPVAAGTFRADVNASGAINATDVSVVKANVGGTLPP